MLGDKKITRGEAKLISMIDAKRSVEPRSRGRRWYRCIYVYAIQGGDKIKIGVAANVKRRLIGLQIGSPVVLRAVDRIRCYSRDEAELVEYLMHRELADLHVHGEWFSDPDRVLEKFKTAKLNLTTMVRDRESIHCGRRS